MGYSVQHKARTRERIVESAARLFRRYGYNGVGIDDIMAAADLTRGGFYAHFKSKRDLFAATLSGELELAARLRRDDASDDGDDSGAARVLIELYLGGDTHRHIASICSLVSLSADVARGGVEARAAYTAALSDLIAEITRCIAGSRDEARARACAVVALCVGGVVLANAVSDDGLVASLLEACRVRALAEIDAGRGGHSSTAPGQ